ncbi:chromate efflux transporter [Bacillus massiliigorillae]|uniref:chromate efflux transporter n=1 Tax=Bacillus massiliigorillae TaxID=1243664 RepID=UPI00039E6C5F|nr:chromate efflux transporter [Bacillus massiliigorillae]
MKNYIEILLTSLKLGVTSFGGPTAHLGYFNEEYVNRKKWLKSEEYTQIIALCQFLPGPASSQVGMAIGLLRGGLIGGFLSFLGFTLPSVLALVIFAQLYKHYEFAEMGWIHGLKLVAVAVVAHAVLGMAQKLTKERSQIVIMVIATIITLLVTGPFVQVGIIIVAGIIGAYIYRGANSEVESSYTIPISKRTGFIAFSVFFVLLIGLPIMSNLFNFHWLNVFDTFYRSGSLVFGGGHVVLPLLENEVVTTGWLSKEEFLAGYGMAQAVPGPLFTFASYIGAMMSGISGSVITTIAIFLPAFLLVVGSLPFYNEVRNRSVFQGALTGIEAAVVGILLAALYDPVWTSAVNEGFDFARVLILYVCLTIWKLPPWMVVILGVVLGSI